MEIINARSALLSNYEVLTLLKEHQSDQLLRAKTAIRVKKEEEQAGEVGARSNVIDNASENLRTVEFEAIQYLSANYHPIHAQSETSITQLVKDLEPFSLTKAEKLQIVNLAPTEPVELYVIVEELEDRLSDGMKEIIEVVRKSLSAPIGNGKSSANTGNDSQQLNLISDNFHSSDNNNDYTTTSALSYVDKRVWEEDAEHEEIYIDMGEGAGVEGDLEMDED